MTTSSGVLIMAGKISKIVDYISWPKIQPPINTSGNLLAHMSSAVLIMAGLYRLLPLMHALGSDQKFSPPSRPAEFFRGTCLDIEKLLIFWSCHFRQFQAIFFFSKNDNLFWGFNNGGTILVAATNARTWLRPKISAPHQHLRNFFGAHVWILKNFWFPDLAISGNSKQFWFFLKIRGGPQHFFHPKF
jgi:hypothetical protein